jgi:ATP-dependent Lhr-like helicase
MKAIASGEGPLDLFLPPVRAWFRAALGEPTRAQALGWPPIARGESTLLIAPTGSGKTLAAFLVAIDRLLRLAPPPAPRPRVLYVSPLKALAVDVERNLRAPIQGIVGTGDAGLALYPPRVDVRTGDTPAAERARMRRSPADVLITTPESLYLLLTSASAHAGLATVDTVIIDEIHALVPGKRGAHLALSIERLEALRPRGARPLQRIGLSATQRPLEEAARLLGGFDDGAERPVTVVDGGARRELRVRVVPVAAGPVQNPADAPPPPSKGKKAKGEPLALATAPARVLELVRAHRSTIVFVNSRRLAERLAAAVNDAHAKTGGEGELALAHHGSLAPEKRAAIEDRLKRGELRAIVATSSLELGIDMGAVDQVVQVEAPPSVASGLQRIGRACHEVGGVPNGVLLPRHKQDLLACAAAAAGMHEGDVEETRMPRNPLDVLAQQIVAMVAMEDLSHRELFARVRRAAPFSDLPRGAFDGVLDMLSGRYPSDDFAELRPRITWDRARGRLSARPGAARLAVTSGGTIPDRGLVGVFTQGATDDERGRRVGELDEEMVFELRVGEVFLLGASSWKAEVITHDRVVVSPAGGRPGKMPFWHGDRPGRARSFGERIGRLTREIAGDTRAAGRLTKESDVEAPAAADLVAYVREQAEATAEVPSDRTIVVERFVDEVGDWRVVVLCPLGTRVIAPWAVATTARLRARYVDVDVHYTDDGMAFRIPACDEAPPAELFLPPSETVADEVTRALQGTALFATRFRECAARALLLPRRDPKRRTPLWAQRKRAADLLAVASRHPTFPMVLEAYRECLRDVFDIPGLERLLRDVEERAVRVATADRRRPSPFAANVLFGFVANFIYDGDAPVAERRAQAMTIDHDRLRELLGDAEARQVLDPGVIAEHERWLQWLSRPATHADAVHDMLLYVGDLSLEEIAARASPPDRAHAWVEQLSHAGRIVAVRIGDDARFVAVEDAARLRDGLGAALPRGLPAELLAPVAEPLRALVARFARTHGPFAPEATARRFAVKMARLEPVFAALVAEGRVVRGAFLPGGRGEELCDRESLDAIRRKSLAKLRRAVEPVGPGAFARFLLHWQGVPRSRRGREGLLDVVGELAGCPLLASSLEAWILPARLEGYRSWELDALCASGEVVWAGIEKIGATDGRVALYRADQQGTLHRPGEPVAGAAAASLRAVLERRGAVFFADLAREAGGFPGELLDTLWAMVWAGEVTNDTLEPLRSRSREAVETRRRAARRARGGPAIASLGVRAPGSEGRWSLLASRRPAATDDAERRTALVQALLARNGLVMRETAHAEGIAGGFAAIYDVLKMLEERGRVRRGYFVEGRGGAQFALPGAEERLRLVRDRPGSGDRSPSTPAADAASRTVVLAATDPANPWGAVVDWPPVARRTDSGDSGGDGASRLDRPQRAAGALVVLHDGEPIAWLGRPADALLTFAPPGAAHRLDAARHAARALAATVTGDAAGALAIATIDGEPATASDLRSVFLEAGFVPGASTLFKRPAPRAARAEQEAR